MQRKALEKHTQRFHKGQPTRETGTTSLFEFAQHTRKKRRIEEPIPNNTNTDSETTQPGTNSDTVSIFSSIATTFTNTVNALVGVLSSLKTIDSSLSNSADRLEKIRRFQ